MKYLLLFMLILPRTSVAQADKVAGLAPYILGLTTPRALDPAEFKEQDQPVVKGTLALLCTHVRTFTASAVMLEDSLITNLVLHFYDDRLFRIDCDYSEPLSRFFTRKFGPGVRKSVSQFRVCKEGDDRFLTVWGEAWPGEDTAAFVVYRKGYTVECQPEEDARLIVWSRRLAALCSECDLQPTNPLMEEYRQLQQGK